MSEALMPTYARNEIIVERGEGPYLFAADGRRYLDFAGGIAVNSLGHSHPHLIAALREMGGRARATAEQQSWEAIVGRFVSMLSEVIDEVA